MMMRLILILQMRLNQYSLLARGCCHMRVPRNEVYFQFGNLILPDLIPFINLVMVSRLISSVSFSLHGVVFSRSCGQ